MTANDNRPVHISFQQAQNRQVRQAARNGLTREYPIEKLLRDARASMIEDGCNDVLSLVGAARLARMTTETGEERCASQP